MSRIFLKAEWRKLIMINYAVDPSVLQKFIPPHTELDLWNDTCYVSLVGFMFMNTKVRGIKIPFHINFEEVNLRFYVKYPQEGDDYKRGVVFIKEIVPKPALTWVANKVYKENYVTMPMKHTWAEVHDALHIEYTWKAGMWNTINVKADTLAAEIASNSEEEFITEHYWGYTRINENKTSEYAVEHPRWKVYPVVDYNVDVYFGKLYGEEFDFLTETLPRSVFLAEGSEIVVRKGKPVS